MGDEVFGIGYFSNNVDMWVFQSCQPFWHVASRKVIDEVGNLLYGLGEHFFNEPTDAFLIGHPVHGTDMIELGLPLNFKVRREIFRINTKRDINDGLGTVFSEIGSVFACNGSDAVNGFQGRQLVFF